MNNSRDFPRVKVKRIDLLSEIFIISLEHLLLIKFKNKLLRK